MAKTDDYVMAVRLGKALRLWVSKEDAKRMGRSALTGVLAHFCNFLLPSYLQFHGV